MEGGAALRRVLRPEPPAVRIDDRAADREADPQAVLLGGLEGSEGVVRDARRKAGAVVSDIDLHLLRAGCPGCDADLSLARPFERFDRVAQDVEHDLLHFDAVDQDRRQRVVKGEDQLDVAVARADQGQRRRLLDDRVDWLEAALALVLLDEAPQPLDDLRGPLGLLARLVYEVRDGRRDPVRRGRGGAALPACNS